LYQQFNKRLNRQGQKFSVIFHYLIAKGTEDERVLKVLEGKSTVQEQLLEGLKAKMRSTKGL
jgi:SNF2 family DNA or RNA helicase